jgi:hypothetical protein
MTHELLPPTIPARFTRRGADLLLQVRCAALNGKLGSAFGQLFKAEVDPVTDMAMAA